MHPILYGARYGILISIDTCFFSWHGNRPLWWTKKLVMHRFDSPIHPVNAFPTKQNVMALSQAKQRHPDRTCYLSLSSKYSPWYGNHFYNEVKVLVKDGNGTHPEREWDGYGMPLSRFESITNKK